MNRTISILLSALLLLTMVPAACAERQNAIIELYSVDGYYEDGVGNRDTYSYHVPQINADTPAAEEINAEIAENFGQRVETHFRYMEDGYSLWSRHTAWEAYWNGSQVFLLVTADGDGDYREYGAYGYDYESGNRITNAMILEQKGISEEQYLEKLREAVSALFEELYVPIPEGVETTLTHDSLLEDTLGWLSADQPIFLNRYGEIETWVSIASPAGAGRYDHLVALPDAKSYEIHLSGDTYLVESCPETARAGETVTVLTYDVTDGDKEISVIGADGENINWFEYQFVMPDHDVEVHLEFIGNGLA
ncbi:MAG: hypothetical protein IJV40_00470 [Oscillospiraceae bacterium]|nr:hypothetical protein [Oscillospiraceae bacterium]